MRLRRAPIVRAELRCGLAAGHVPRVPSRGDEQAITDASEVSKRGGTDSTPAKSRAGRAARKASPWNNGPMVQTFENQTRFRQWQNERTKN